MTALVALTVAAALLTVAIQSWRDERRQARDWEAWLKSTPGLDGDDG